MTTIKSKLSFLKELFYLKEVMDAGSIQAAAIRNGIKQTNLSKLISNLEQYLGMTLLHRSSTGVTPTNSARLLYADIDAISMKLDVIFDSFLDKNDLTGSMILWAEEGFVGTRILKELSLFYAQYPKIRLDILTSKMVNLSTVDIAVGYQEDHAFSNGKILFKTQVNCRFYSTQNYLSRKGLPKNIDDLLENYDLCMRQRYLNWPECDLIVKKAKHLNTTADATSIILNLVQSGDGISLLPDWSAKACPALVPLENIPFITTRTFVGVCRPGLENEPKIKILSAFLEETMNKKITF